MMGKTDTRDGRDKRVKAPGTPRMMYFPEVGKETVLPSDFSQRDLGGAGTVLPTETMMIDVNW